MSSTNAWLRSRAASCAPGTLASAQRTAPGIGLSNFGRHQIGVRWKTVSCSTSGAISGISCTAEAPVPITATRLPASSAFASQRAVWIVSPANESTPGISGFFGTVSTPLASTMSRTTSSSPASVSTRQAWMLLVEAGAGDLRVEAGLVLEPVLVRAALGVGAQLLAGGVGAGPVGALRERVLVGERGDVDREAGVAVPVPGAAEALALLDDQVVADAGLLEPDRGADPREAGADDQDLVVEGGGGGGRWGLGDAERPGAVAVFTVRGDGIDPSWPASRCRRGLPNPDPGTSPTCQRSGRPTQIRAPATEQEEKPEADFTIAAADSAEDSTPTATCPASSGG